MRDLLLKIFNNDIGGPEFNALTIWHILFFLIMAGVTIFMALFFSKKEEKTKKLVLDIYAIVIIGLYLSDFLVHPFMTGENALIVDKLPYHICTVSAILIAITRIFPNHTKHIQTAVPVLGLAGALMYMTYPNGVGGYVFSYKVLQTMLYHSCVITYGVCTMAYGFVKPDFKKIYVEAIMIAALVLISLGANSAYATEDHHYDWFFTTGSSFGMNKYAMPFIIFAIFMAMCASIYLIYFGIKILIEKKKNKKQE